MYSTPNTADAAPKVSTAPSHPDLGLAGEQREPQERESSDAGCSLGEGTGAEVDTIAKIGSLTDGCGSSITMAMTTKA